MTDKPKDGGRAAFHFKIGDRVKNIIGSEAVVTGLKGNIVTVKYKNGRKGGGYPHAFKLLAESERGKKSMKCQDCGKRDVVFSDKSKRHPCGPLCVSCAKKREKGAKQ
jgi:hypothetical protein